MQSDQRHTSSQQIGINAGMQKEKKLSLDGVSQTGARPEGSSSASSSILHGSGSSYVKKVAFGSIETGIWVPQPGASSSRVRRLRRGKLSSLRGAVLHDASPTIVEQEKLYHVPIETHHDFTGSKKQKATDCSGHLVDVPITQSTSTGTISAITEQPTVISHEQVEKNGQTGQAYVRKETQPTGRKRSRRGLTVNIYSDVPQHPLRLPTATNCRHCGAKRFHSEPPHFCCSSGSVSLVSPPMPHDLQLLLIDNEEDSIHFRRNIRTYNNNFAFTSLGAKYDKDLTKNHYGVYTFRVQGQVYHLLNGLHPHPSERPTGVQLYFFDTEEEIKQRLNSCDKLNESVLRRLQKILEQNPYCSFLKHLSQLQSLDDKFIVLTTSPELDQRRFNLPSTSQVGAIFLEDELQCPHSGAHIQIYSTSTVSHAIKHFYGCYDPLQYPLLFPRGETGWHPQIPRKIKKRKIRCDKPGQSSQSLGSVINSVDQLLDLEEAGVQRSNSSSDNNVTAREYYSYKFQMRDNDESMLLHTGRVLQQFAVDAYVKIETARLDFHRRQQKQIRTEILQGVLDSVSVGQTSGANVGRRIVLPASFIGGPRDMRRRYLDAMALVKKYGKPDIFLTMTCNPNWPEIQENLKYDESPNDRPDLLARVFRAKLDILKTELIQKKFFGQVAAFVYVIEFQNRGMPHCHLLLILKPVSKLLGPAAYDRFVCAELPDPNLYPHLYSLVRKHMMHGPCGILNPKCPCMKSGACKNHYPKDFNDHTYHADDSYPQYRRQNDGKKVRVRGHDLDNRWVVPYNPYLLALFDCHLNVEICSTIKLVKYVYKYIYKGHDVVAFSFASPDELTEIDEIKDFQNGRWVGPSEAMWRIYGFNLNQMNPSVYTLQVHIQGHQFVSFPKDTDLQSLADNSLLYRTMLTEFFYMNNNNDKAKHLNCLYREFPEYFVWSSKTKQWAERKKARVIGRLVTVHPNEGERYYLRLLLSHVRGPVSYSALMTVDGKQLSSFREAALQLGFLHSDNYIEEALEEASQFQMPCTLRLLFSMLLVYCAPDNPKLLWEKFKNQLSADIHRTYNGARDDLDFVYRKVLQDINNYLNRMGKSIKDYQLVHDELNLESNDFVTREIDSERSIVVSAEDILLASKLNPDQCRVYEIILAKVFSTEGQAYFVDGPGGTGKTFLYCALLATLRSQGFTALAVATSGVAASGLPGGRTAHSRFKIPLDSTANKVCQLSKQSSVAKLIVEAKIIIWDEASMARRDMLESVDSLLRDLMNCEKPFGGKVIVFGGDFRQTLPVIEKASKQKLIECSIVNSCLWPHIEKLSLTMNMRALLDQPFSEFLLKVGEGKVLVDENNQISLPVEIVVPYKGKEQSLNRLIDYVFTDLSCYALNPMQMVSRCILAPKNDAVDDVNNMLIERFPGTVHIYTSVDSTLDEKHQGDFEDFLNTLNPKGFPPHKLLLKPNCPIILLRNLNPTEGLCNGTRLICRQLGQNTITAEIAFKQYKGKIVFLPKIPLSSPNSEKQNIAFKRFQFPVKLCFAMTVNKSQGQTLDYVGVYLQEPVFSHGQLYVALSRARTAKAVKVLIVPPTFDEEKLDTKTVNVVYSEIFTLTAQ